MKRGVLKKKKVYKTAYAAYRWGTKEDQVKAEKALAKKSQHINAVYTKLCEAIRSNDIAAIARLLKQWGVTKYSTYGSFPLDEAVLAHNNDAVRLILDAGGEVNQKNFEGDTALMTAAFKGYADTVQLLLDSGADPTVVNQFKETPLSHAQKHGHTNVVQLLESTRSG